MPRIVQKSMGVMRLRKGGERIFLIEFLMIVSTWHGHPGSGFGLEPNIFLPIRTILLRIQPTRHYWEPEEFGRRILNPCMKHLPECEPIPFSRAIHYDRSFVDKMACDTHRLGWLGFVILQAVRPHSYQSGDQKPIGLRPGSYLGSQGGGYIFSLPFAVSGSNEDASCHPSHSLLSDLSRLI